MIIQVFVDYKFMLKKEFKKKDVERVRNLIRGKSEDSSETQIGYNKKLENHKEGDIWTENRKTWTIKNGIKQTISKLDAIKKEVFMPLCCPECNKVMKKRLDKPHYRIHKKCWWEGDDVMGDVEILNTPAGNILKALFASGITVGISSRGMGSVKENMAEGTVEVQEDFELLCWDFVSTPSTHGAFMAPKGFSIQEGKTKLPEYKYTNVNNIIRDILCDNTGVCRL